MINYRGSGPGYFHDLYVNALTINAVVMAVHESVFLGFLSGMTKYKESHDDFAAFVIPVSSNGYSQEHALVTISRLAAIGIPAGKILTVINDREKEYFAREDFSLLLSGGAEARQFTWSETAMVYPNKIYPLLDQGGTLTELLGSGIETDHGMVGDEAAISEAAQRRAYQRLARSAVENLNQVFAALFGAAAWPAVRLPA
jgi:hypothetical protein